MGLPGDLVSNIINKEAYRKLPGSYKNFQGRNPYNIFDAILENGCPHKFILSLTDLYLGFKRCEMHEERYFSKRVQTSVEDSLS